MNILEQNIIAEEIAEEINKYFNELSHNNKNTLRSGLVHNFSFESKDGIVKYDYMTEPYKLYRQIQEILLKAYDYSDDTGYPIIRIVFDIFGGKEKLITNNENLIKIKLGIELQPLSEFKSIFTQEKKY